MDVTEKPISPKEVHIALGIGDSTLRKWCLALEEHGYSFSRTDNNRRVFYDKDLEVLRHFRHLIQVQNFSMENAAIVVSSKFKQDALPKENSDNSVPALRDPGEIMNKLWHHIEQQEAFNKELMKRLDEQQKYIEERLNQRDRQLTETLRLMAAAKEEKKKGFFSRFFNKK